MRNGGEATPVVARALQLLQALGVDEATETATRLSVDFDGSPKAAEACRKQWGSEVTTLLVALHRMAGLGHRVSADGAEDTPGQIETLRRMLLALADDIRVVVIQLALHIATLESVAAQMKARDAAALERGRRLGQETLKVQAPLANRLGIWQLK
ncbi:MAG: hypothetical protein RI937_1309, partial [Pseudomonadota bacterium]